MLNIEVVISQQLFGISVREQVGMFFNGFALLVKAQTI